MYKITNNQTYRYQPVLQAIVNKLLRSSEWWNYSKNVKVKQITNDQTFRYQPVLRAIVSRRCRDSEWCLGSSDRPSLMVHSQAKGNHPGSIKKSCLYYIATWRDLTSFLVFLQFAMFIYFIFFQITLQKFYIQYLAPALEPMTSWSLVLCPNL